MTSKEPVPFQGIGGFAPYSLERAGLLFADGNRLRAYSLDVAILNVGSAAADEDEQADDGEEEEPSIPTIPSVLGRDILNNGWMRYDPLNSRLEFMVKRADLTVRASLSDIGSYASP